MKNYFYNKKDGNDNVTGWKKPRGHLEVSCCGGGPSLWTGGSQGKGYYLLLYGSTNIHTSDDVYICVTYFNKPTYQPTVVQHYHRFVQTAVCSTSRSPSPGSSLISC